MKERRIYLRKHPQKGWIYETKVKNRTKHLLTLPSNHFKFLTELSRLIMCNCPECEKFKKSSFFKTEKWVKIDRILQSADLVEKKYQKPDKKVRTRNIMRNPEMDDFSPDSELNFNPDEAIEWVKSR